MSPKIIVQKATGQHKSLSRVFEQVSQGTIDGPTDVAVKNVVIPISPSNTSFNGMFLRTRTLPEEIVGRVRKIDEEWASVPTSLVQVFQLDPFAGFGVHFDWHTEMAIEISLLGDVLLYPEGEFTVGFPNGTEYKITRFATTLLGRTLNIGGCNGYEMTLNSTNVRLGPPS